MYVMYPLVFIVFMYIRVVHTRKPALKSDLTETESL